MKKATLAILMASAIMLSFMAGAFFGRSNFDGVISVEAAIKSPNFDKIDINNATLDELCLVPGISYITANKIVDYRDKHGGFKNIEELCNIKGISYIKMNKFKSYFIIGQP